MSRSTTRRPYYWERFTDGNGAWLDEKKMPPGADLAALRRGIGQEVGTVPQMWSLYATRAAEDDGSSDLARKRRIAAEHVALTLYGSHQQARSRPVHRNGIGLGRAITNLKLTERFSEQALERRFAAAATATSFSELIHHLRGLVALLRADQTITLDYTTLVADLTDWQYDVSRSRTVRKWGLDYVWSSKDDEESTDTGEK
jgi:CRISPR system Cascade subunit CasB